SRQGGQDAGGQSGGGRRSRRLVGPGVVGLPRLVRGLRRRDLARVRPSELRKGAVAHVGGRLGVSTPVRKTVVVAGNGMVGHKLVELLLERDATATWDIVVFGEERRPAYDRV